MAGHAVRLAMDLGLNRAFNELLQTGMGAGKTGAELERERALVEKARVWYCVCPSLLSPADIRSFIAWSTRCHMA